MSDWQPFLAFEGIHGSRDKLGIETAEADYFVKTLAQARSWVPPDLEQTLGLVIVSSQYSQEWGNGALIAVGKDGAYRVKFTLAGIQNIGDTELGLQFDGDGTLVESPIESNRFIQFLINSYGGYEDSGSPGRILFPQELPGNSDDTNGVDNTAFFGGEASGMHWSDIPATDQAGEGAANPMFGVKKYRSPHLVWAVSYATKVPRPDVTGRLGKIDTPRPDPNGYLPRIPDGFNWLKTIGKPILKGNVYRVTEGWEAGDWLRDIYR